MQEVMKGRLEKTNKGWKVLYTQCLPHRMVMEWSSSLPLHPEYVKYYFLDEEDNGQEVEFERSIIVDHDSGKGMEYAKLLKSYNN